MDDEYDTDEEDRERQKQVLKTQILARLNKRIKEDLASKKADSSDSFHSMQNAREDYIRKLKQRIQDMKESQSSSRSLQKVSLKSPQIGDDSVHDIMARQVSLRSLDQAIPLVKVSSRTKLDAIRKMEGNATIPSIPRTESKGLPRELSRIEIGVAARDVSIDDSPKPPIKPLGQQSLRTASKLNQIPVTKVPRVTRPIPIPALVPPPKQTSFNDTKVHFKNAKDDRMIKSPSVQSDISPASQSLTTSPRLQPVKEPLQPLKEPKESIREPIKEIVELTEQDLASEEPSEKPMRPISLIKCHFCERTFNSERIQKHEMACEKLALRDQRVHVLDPKQMRLRGTEFEKFASKASLTKPSSKPKEKAEKLEKKGIRGLL